MATELRVISDFYDFALYLSQRIERFPRHHRYALGQSIEQRLQLILGLLLRAKYSADKHALLHEANMELQVLRFQVRMAHDLKALSHNSHGHGSRQLLSIGGQIGNWIKSSSSKAGS